MITSIVFDVDDTIYDQQAPYRIAMEKCFPDFDMSHMNQAYIRFRHYSDVGFPRVMAGEWTTEYFRFWRCKETLLEFGYREIDEETGKLGFTHNPFSMPQGGLEALNTMDPLDILAYQYDIVCNGVELSSGAVRNHDMQIMVKAFEIAGYDEEVLKAKFGALYNAFQFGAPPHAGMAPGVDRMIMLLRNEENIREIIPFPMSGTAQDLMCGAPNEVTEQQLREVHIKVRD